MNLTCFLGPTTSDRSLLPVLRAGRAFPVTAATDLSHEDLVWLIHLFMVWHPAAWLLCVMLVTLVTWQGRDGMTCCTCIGAISGFWSQLRFSLAGWELLHPGAAEWAGMGLAVKAKVWKVSVPYSRFECCCVSIPLITSGSQRGWLGALLITGFATSMMFMLAVGGLESQDSYKPKDWVLVCWQGLHYIFCSWCISLQFSLRRADDHTSILQSSLVNLKIQKVFTATFNFKLCHSCLLLTKKTNLKISY